MSQEQLNIKMDSQIIAKLRRYFAGEIGYHLEKKALELIAEMEEVPKPISKKFQIYEEGMYVCYAPQKFMDKKQYYRIISTIPDNVPITSELIVDIINGRIKSWQQIPSKKGTWPGKEEPETN